VPPDRPTAAPTGSGRHTDGVLLKACLNGPRRPPEHPALPVTPEQVAAASAAAVAAGAGAIHVHPKGDDGADTLDAAAVAAVLDAVRAAVPGTPVGVTTGAYILPGEAERLAAVRAWDILPDFASVNWHEPGALDLASHLLDVGVGIEAGLWTPAAVEAWKGWPARDRCLRVLLEVVTGTDAETAVAAAGELVRALDPTPGVSVLLHAHGEWSWPVLEEAVRLGLDTRIGLEDSLVLPDGQPARDNADLVAAARRIINKAEPG
jgi:uncharacterized protein (DUF849 family)